MKDPKNDTPETPVGEITEDERKLLASLHSAASDIVFQLGKLRLKESHLIQGASATGLIERLASDERPNDQFRATMRRTISQLGQTEIDKARLTTDLFDIEARVETLAKEIGARFNVPGDKFIDIRGHEVYVV
jgi:hypothetical protein